MDAPHQRLQRAPANGEGRGCCCGGAVGRGRDGPPPWLRSQVREAREERDDGVDRRSGGEAAKKLGRIGAACGGWMEAIRCVRLLLLGVERE